jgi:hypothetical protein
MKAPVFSANSFHSGGSRTLAGVYATVPVLHVVWVPVFKGTTRSHAGVFARVALQVALLGFERGDEILNGNPSLLEHA